MADTFPRPSHSSPHRSQIHYRVLSGHPRFAAVWTKSGSTNQHIQANRLSASSRAIARSAQAKDGLRLVAINARGSDYVMPDVMKIGGVSGWLRAAALADTHRPEVESVFVPHKTKKKPPAKKTETTKPTTAKPEPAPKKTTKKAAATKKQIAA